jgi:hypothetical protein
MSSFVLPDCADFPFYQPNVTKKSQIGQENVSDLATRTVYLNSQNDSEGCFGLEELSTPVFTLAGYSRTLADCTHAWPV